jgi:endonuclease YncB( thermonuclease family)
MTRKPQEKTDKYGRFLAVLYYDLPPLVPNIRMPAHPSSINARMIVEGHAKERYW